MTVRTIESVSEMLASTFPDHRTYTFHKEDNCWYIDLPEYLKQGGAKKDLQLRAGTAKLLKSFAQGKDEVTLAIDTEPFDGANVLELTELCSDPKGGAVYEMKTVNGYVHTAQFWICDIALFVFGDMPERIYIRKS